MKHRAKVAWMAAGAGAVALLCFAGYAVVSPAAALVAGFPPDLVLVMSIGGMAAMLSVLAGYMALGAVACFVLGAVILCSDNKVS